jgi:hypothetical protein
VADAASRIVRLREERSGADSRFLDAYLDGEGNLHVDGQDLGPATSMSAGTVSTSGSRPSRPESPPTRPGARG